jgi:hypothetical protein
MPVPPTAQPDGETWTADAARFRGANGQAFDYACPAHGVAQPVWGTLIYTDDSSVCTAAVHHGAIGFEAGGWVRIVIRPGLPRYQGSIRNGVTSQDWAEPWKGSFTVATP